MSKSQNKIEILDRPADDLSRDIWLSVTKVAELTGLHNDSIREACAERDGKYRGGSYIFHKVGRKYEISLQSLPNNAQIKYLESMQNALKSKKNTELTVKSSSQLLDFNAYNAMADAYERKPTSIKLQTESRIKILDEFNALLANNIKKQDAEKIIKSKYSNASKITLWRWCALVEGHDRAYWVYLLAPNYEGRSKRPICQAAYDHWLSLYSTQAKPAASVCYYQTIQANKTQKWGELPSLKTFLRHYELTESQNFKIFTRQGKTALKESLPHIKRDYNTIDLHGYWESDGRKADVLCTWPDGTVSRPWIVVMRDVRTRMVLARLIGKTNDKALVIEAFRQACILSQTRPQGFILDNGSEYSCKAFTGSQRSDVRYKSTEKEPLGILTRMGIVVHWATPYHGAAKPIESFWNVIAEYADKTCGKAYVGNNTVNRPEDTDAKHAITIEEYADKLSGTINAWCIGDFGIHRGHGMNGKSPIELYTEMMHAYVAKPATNEEINSMRDMIFTRVLSRQCTFSITIDGYGKVEYEASDNDNLKRGSNYDLLPNISNPKEPALIYQGSNYLGQAIYKAHMPFFSISDDSNPSPNQKRASIVKKQNKQLSDLKKRVLGLTPISNNTNLILPGPALRNDIKYAPVKPASVESPIKTLADGSVTNTFTGNVFKPLESDLSFMIDSNDSKVIVNELDKKRQQKIDDEVADWEKKVQVNQAPFN